MTPMYHYTIFTLLKKIVQLLEIYFYLFIVIIMPITIRSANNLEIRISVRQFIKTLGPFCIRFNVIELTYIP